MTRTHTQRKRDDCVTNGLIVYSCLIDKVAQITGFIIARLYHWAYVRFLHIFKERHQQV